MRNFVFFCLFFIQFIAHNVAGYEWTYRLVSQKGGDGVAMYGFNSPSKGEDEYNCLLKHAQTLPAETSWAIVEIRKLPPHEYWYAWYLQGDRIFLDLEKIREEQMAKIRLLRNCMLKDLDVAFIRALETQDANELAHIKNMKQQLREIPQSFSLGQMTTVDQITTAMPEILRPLEQEMRELEAEGHTNSGGYKGRLRHEAKKRLLY